MIPTSLLYTGAARRNIVAGLLPLLLGLGERRLEPSATGRSTAGFTDTSQTSGILSFYSRRFTSMSPPTVNLKPDSVTSRGENIRELRNGGLNWNEIAEAYGWRLQARNGSA